MPVETRRIVTRFAVVAVALPAVIVTTGVVMMLTALPALPDPVATHWGVTGTPDGFGPVWLPIVMLTAVGLGLPALLGLLTLPALRRSERGGAYRLLGATALGLSSFLTVLVAVSTMRQAGLTDAAAGPQIWGPLAIAAAAGAAGTALGWFLQPRQRFEPTPLDPAVPMKLSTGERVIWLQRATMSRSGTIVLLAALGLTGAVTVTVAVVAAEAVTVWLTSVLMVLLSLLVAANLVFHVRVDDQGLTATSALGWPRTRVPLEDVAHAAVVEVNPMADFGGWGLRWAPTGRFGLVLRTGPGIEVRRRSGKSFTVTVDDAATGAALLSGLAERAAATGAAEAGR